MNLNLTDVGKSAIAKLITEQDLFLAWGTGAASDADRSSLVSELGRRRLVIAGFVTPDPDGDIEIPVGSQVEKYSRSVAPTPLVYLKVSFDFSDDADAEISEIGLFMNTTVSDDLPAGQQYFSPDQITDSGALLCYQALTTPIGRSPDTKQTFEFVLPIIG